VEHPAKMCVSSSSKFPISRQVTRNLTFGLNWMALPVSSLAALSTSCWLAGREEDRRP
jgi:hypothetical protein